MRPAALPRIPTLGLAEGVSGCLGREKTSGASLDRLERPREGTHPPCLAAARDERGRAEIAEGEVAGRTAAYLLANPEVRFRFGPVLSVRNT